MAVAISAKPAEVRRLWLALASVDGAVSLDVLAGSGLWRMSELWVAVEQSRAEGVIVVDASAGLGHLRWADAIPRAAALAESTDEDFAALLVRAPFPELLLAGARAAARERDFARAALVYKALVAAPDRTLFADGERAWVAAIVESIRLFRSVWAAPGPAVETALAIAEAHGDLAAQVTLLGARGLQLMATDRPRCEELWARATDAAEAIGDARLRAEIRTYIAVGLVLGGRLREGIAAFEEMLGDVPADPLDVNGPMLDLEGAAPAAALGILSAAYVYSGDHPRALDLLERVRRRGQQLQNPALEKLGELFIAVTYVVVGQVELAAPYAEAAFAYFADIAISYTWYAALSVAWVRVEEGRFEDARATLVRAMPAFRRAGRPFVCGSRALMLLERLEQAAQPPIEGLELDGEIDRHLEAPQPFLAGVAHRFKARRLLARERSGSGSDSDSGGGADEAAIAEAAAAHLERAVGLLRESGGRPELRLALVDAAELAAARGRVAEAAQLREEAASLAPAAPAVQGATREDVLRLASAVLDLGRLGALAPRRDGLWGEVVARICRAFSAERCAIVESPAEGGPVLLAVRGGTDWRDALLERLRRDPPQSPCFEPALPMMSTGGASGEASPLPSSRPGGGQLALVPFADEEIGRCGFVALENRETAPAIGPGDETLVAALGRQVGILIANVGLWRELTEVRQRLEQENRYYREAPTAALGGGRIIGGAPSMRQVLELVRRVAPSTAPVLVTGETGVGKELVSREVHLLSPRKDGPFIAVHVAALAPGLVASALFGHERGAFTGATEQAKGRFELADGGTLFLDEVGELSLENQVRLLRVLQEGTFERVGGTRVIRSDFRLVAATNRDLAAEVQAGRFREDLYFRLNAFPICVPPLRQRREEVATLALYFMERTNRKLGLRFEGISESDMERLVGYDWPGNVRELEHVIERAALLSDPPRLRIPPLESGPLLSEKKSALLTLSGGRGAAGVEGRDAVTAAAEWVTLEEIERRYIRRVLRHANGRVSGAGGAADILGLKPSTLQFWVDKLGLRDELQKARTGRGRTRTP